MLGKLLFAVLLLCTTTNAAPTKATPKDYPPSSTASQASKHALEDIQLIQPHIITIEHFEELLRRAGEIFRPAAFQLAKEKAAPSTVVTPQHQATAVAVPYQQMQPPTAQPYNFYLPLFDYDDNPKLDAKSRQLGQITPPPVPSDQDAQTDYYAAAAAASDVKPRKLPKKFSAVAKQVNIKWLNAFEKEIFGNGAVAADAVAVAAGDSGELLPAKTAVYLVHDERNRINFDDSFFGVDMQMQAPANNEPHRVQATAAATQANAENDATHAQSANAFLKQGEQMNDGGEELEQEEDEEADDLLAASQVPQVNYVTVKAETV